MRFIPMINGRGWEFDHQGWTYQLVHLNGSRDVRLYYRMPGEESFSYGHSREIPEGMGARGVATEIARFITAPIGA